MNLLLALDAQCRNELVLNPSCKLNQSVYVGSIGGVRTAFLQRDTRGY